MKNVYNTRRDQLGHCAYIVGYLAATKGMSPLQQVAFITDVMGIHQLLLSDVTDDVRNLLVGLAYRTCDQVDATASDRIAAGHLTKLINYLGEVGLSGDKLPAELSSVLRETAATLS